MSDLDVETEVTPPEVDEDEDDNRPSCRIGAHLIGADDYHYDAGAMLYDVDAVNPDAIAEGLLKVMLCLSRLHSSEVGWALQQRLIDYDGSRG